MRNAAWGPAVMHGAHGGRVHGGDLEDATGLVLVKPKAAKAVALLCPTDALVCIIFHVCCITLCAPVI